MPKRLLVLLAFICLTGMTWSKTLIYSGMKEHEINEMLVLLLTNGIDSTREKNKEGFSIYVDSTQVARALKLVHSYGLPRDEFLSLGDVFSNEGIISSPKQEQIRFIYALSQELEETISNIENVLVARVHIVLVSDNDLGEMLYPSSASVFIKHRSDSQLPQLVPRIKQLVANSVPGLEYNGVNVVLFETTIPEITAIPTQRIIINWLQLIGIGGGLLVLVGGAGVYFYRRRKERAAAAAQVPKEPTPPTSSLDFAVERKAPETAAAEAPTPKNTTEPSGTPPEQNKENSKVRTKAPEQESTLKTDGELPISELPETEE